MLDLSHLNDVQKNAVLETDGPMMLLAGAGSGKTRTLVTRIQYLLEEKKINAHKLLAVTFSNKAAKEMRERIAKSSKYDLGALQITTFHAFCAKLLRNEAKYIGLSRNFTIYDTSESKTIVKSLLTKRGISLKELSPYEILNYIESLKNLGHYSNEDSPDESIDKSDPFYTYFLEYEQELFKSNALDFGGLITGVINLLDQFPQVKERYQKRFEYILVDEYQDTNRAQFKLVTTLAKHHMNICVVGDEDQSIYSWRGADIRNILDFEKVYENAKLLKLEQNYRSSKNIIEAATQVISQNLARKGKQMWTDNHKGDDIQIYECQDDRVEASVVANEIKSLQQSGASLDDIAVFYRTNAQSRILEDQLRVLKIPYKVVAGIKFYERKEIKDLLGYLRLIVNSKDALALSRIINTPTRGIGAVTLRKIEEEAIKLDVSLWDILEKISNDIDDFKHLRLSAKVKSGIRRFVDLIQEAKILDDRRTEPSLIYEKLLAESGYYEALVAEKSYESQARLENLDELLNAIKQYELEEKEATLLGFLETITLDSNVDKQGEQEVEQEVSLMTIHGAKGLEYPYVFVTGLEENVFPSFQSMDSGDDSIEEERRLFYVAMTRAMKRLYLLFAQARMLWGSLRFNAPSRFIEEVPKDYYEWTFKGKNKQSKKQENDSFDQSGDFYDEEKVFYVEKEKPKSSFSEGEKVKHKIYGEGKVFTTQGYGSDEKITIIFKDGSRKKFLLKFAPIEKI